MIDSRPRLRAALGEVFSGETPPGVITGLGETVDGKRASEMLAGRTWQELSVAHVDRLRGALLFLSPEAFRYYAPAFVMATVFSGRYGQDHAAHLLLGLSRPHEAQGPAYARYFATRGSMLSDAQHRCVVDVIERVTASLTQLPRKYWWSTIFSTELARIGRPTPADIVDGPEPWASLAKIRDDIRRCFPTMPLPAPTTIVRDAHGGTDQLDVHRLFGGEPWTTAPLAAVMWGRASISFITPEGFARYLPAYLFGMLDPTVYGSEISDTVAFELGRLMEQLTSGPNHAEAAARWAALTVPQRRVVAAALEELGNRRRDAGLLHLAARWREEAPTRA